MIVSASWKCICIGKRLHVEYCNDPFKKKGLHWLKRKLTEGKKTEWPFWLARKRNLRAQLRTSHLRRVSAASQNITNYIYINKYKSLFNCHCLFIELGQQQLHKKLPWNILFHRFYCKWENFDLQLHTNDCNQLVI